MNENDELKLKLTDTEGKYRKYYAESENKLRILTDELERLNGII